MAEPETESNIVKYAYTWIAIMLVVNFITAGYNIANSNNIQNLGEDNIYTKLMQEQSQTKTNIISLQNSTTGYSAENINNEEPGLLDYILDAVDKILNFTKWIFYIVGFITLGGYFTGWYFFTIFDGTWFGIIMTIFLWFGNSIFLILITKFVANKMRF